jgi:hypothetical protein
VGHPPHYRGRAADIDFINGQPTTQANYDENPAVTDVINQLDDYANASGAHEVYSPGAALYKNGQPFVPAKVKDWMNLIKLHTTHVHVTVASCACK